MLNAEAVVTVAVLALGLFKHAEDDLIRAITDGMHGDLKACRVSREDVSAHLAFRNHLIAR